MRSLTLALVFAVAAMLVWAAPVRADTPIKLVALSGHYKNSYTFEADYDNVWKAVVQVVTDAEYTLETIDKDSGIVVTALMPSKANPEYVWVKDTKKDPRPGIFIVEEEYYDENKKKMLGMHPRGRHSFRVRVRQLEPGKTTVTVKCKESLDVSHIRPGGTEPGYGVSAHLPLSLWTGTKETESMGYKEHKFLEAVGELVGADVPSADQPINPILGKKRR